jgi:hypothetical protein
MTIPKYRIGLSGGTSRAGAGVGYSIPYRRADEAEDLSPGERERELRARASVDVMAGKTPNGLDLVGLPASSTKKGRTISLL